MAGLGSSVTADSEGGDSVEGEATTEVLAIGSGGVTLPDGVGAGIGTGVTCVGELSDAELSDTELTAAADATPSEGFGAIGTKAEGSNPIKVTSNQRRG
jgi:hypothetical protein